MHKTLKLDVAYSTLSVDVDAIAVCVDLDMITKLRMAMQLCKKHGFDKIKISNPYVEFLSDGELANFDCDVCQFAVDKSSVYIYAQNKHDSSEQIESTPFGFSKGTIISL